MSEIAKSLTAVAALTEEFPPTKRTRPDAAQRRSVREAAREEGFGFNTADPQDDERAGEGLRPESPAEGTPVAKATPRSAPASAPQPAATAEVIPIPRKKSTRVSIRQAVGARVFGEGEDKTQMHIYCPVPIALDFYEIEKLTGMKKAELMATANVLLRQKLGLKPFKQ